MQAPGVIAPDQEGRQRIVRVAFPLFVAHGFQAVSMQDVADAAGIHKATLYHYFRDKEDLFSAVVETGLLASRDETAAEIARGGTPAEQLTRVAVRLFAQSESDVGRFMTDAYERLSPERRARVFSEPVMPWGLLERIVAGAIERGDLPPIDPRFAVTTFFGMVWGQTLARRLAWQNGPLDASLASALVRVLFAGLQDAPLTKPAPRPAGDR